MKNYFKEAADLIRDRGNWTTETYARTADHTPVSPNNPAAVRWCMLGALSVATGGVRLTLLADLSEELSRLCDRKHRVSTTTVNDILGHEAAVAVLDAAAAEWEEIHARPRP